MNLIEERVELARRRENPYVISKPPSGWVVLGDVQPLPGYCLLLADPVVPDLNSLDEAGRTQYLLDTARIGDALLSATGAYRINYETLGNAEPALHTHIIPRYPDEPDEKRGIPAMMAYSWREARRFSPVEDAGLMERVQRFLAGS